VALTPGRYEGWADLADACHWSGQEAKALDACSRAIRLARSELQVNARNPTARARIAVCLARAGDAAGARGEIGQALALTQKDPRVLYDAAIVASLAKKKQESVDWVGRAVEAGCGIEQIRREPQFADLRNDPDFDRALRRKPSRKP